jgi:hypothetical protein
MVATLGIVASSYMASAPPTTETQLRQQGNSPNPWIQCADSAAIEALTDFDLAWFGSIDNAAAAAQGYLNKFTSSTNNREYLFRKQASTPLLEGFYSSDGIVQPSMVSTGLGLGSGVYGGVRWTRRMSDGLMRMYRSVSDPPVWVKIGELIANAGTGIFDGNAQIIAGGHTGNTVGSTTGYFRRAEIRNGFDGGGSLIASPDVRGLALGTSSFLDAQGNTWVYNGTAGGLVTMPIPTPAACQSVRFNASTAKYSRASIGTGAGDFTWCAWIKLAVNTGTYAMALSIDNAGSNYYHMGTQGNGSTLWIDTNSTSQGNSLNASVGTWYFIAHSYSASGNDFYYDAVAGSPTLTQSFAGNTAGPLTTGTFYIGSDGYVSQFNGSVACVRMWTAALTKAELEAEMAKVEVQRAANLFAHYSFRYGPQTIDESGGGKTLTAGGTPILDTSGPPVT